MLWTATTCPRLLPLVGWTSPPLLSGAARLALRLGALPLEEVLEIVDELNDDTLKGVFHCFTGNEAQAKHILEYGGFKLGVGGVVTFKNAGVDKTLATVSLDHLMLETDSPYLAPTP